jgi:hypothetical protein
MKIVITFGELVDRGLWVEFCEFRGLNTWIMAEGLADDTDETTLSEAEAQKLGLIPPKEGEE